MPTHRALWVPDGLSVAVHNVHPVAVRSLYFTSSLRAAPAGVETIAVTGFLRHLWLHVVRVCPIDDAEPGQSALLTVLLDQLRELPDLPLALPLPRDPRTRRAADSILDSDDDSPSKAAESVGISRRTLERRFVAEVGMMVGAWRRRARILRSLETLAAGASVAQAGLQAGYSAPSAFVAAFRRELGRSPRAFVERNP